MKIVKKIRLQKIVLVVVLLLFSFFNITPTSAVADNFFSNKDFFSDSEIQLYDPNACDPNSPNCCPAGQSVVSGSLTGKDNEEKIWKYLTGKGLDPKHAAGIMGNLKKESGYRPDVQEGGKSPPLGGYGIAQWTGNEVGNRRYNVIKAIAAAGIAVDTQKQIAKAPIDQDKLLSAELDFMWKEATDRGDIAKLKTTSSPGEAAQSWMDNYERALVRIQPDRVAVAEALVAKYGGGGGSTAALDMGSDTGPTVGTCTCSAPTTKGAVTVVLDPGHSETTVEETDPDTGIETSDGNNGQENKDVWEVSEKVKSILEDKGYAVVSTKKKEDDSVGLIARADIANKANADIAVSIHTTPGEFGSESAGWVTPQEVGLSRKTGDNEKKFTDKDVADKSKKYANVIVSERKKTEKGVQIHRLDFPASRGLGAVGNISIVQLFSSVPWVYNEAGQTGLNKEKYAEGIANGIIKAVGKSGKDNLGGGCDEAVAGDLSETIKAYAWPDYHAAPYLKRRPAWAKVADDPKSHYVGGTVSGVKGIDCGGFVTMTIRNSGIDPGYNPNKGNTTGGQIPYLENQWEKLTISTTADLQPGDVAINTSHTFLYVGQIDGFNDVFASASHSENGNGRAPMAGQGDAMSGKYTWYRKK